jgi:aldose 1-epimerase
MPGASAVESFVLKSKDVEMSAMSYGAIITSVHMASREGPPVQVVLGHADLGAFRRNAHYLGAVVGRYANRIAAGRFTLNGESCQLVTNNGPHHLHGGARGFDQQLWTVGAVEGESVTFSRISPAGEERYPGAVWASVTYQLVENVVAIRYFATSNRDTPINLTQHTYFNLSGEPASTILDHELTIHADAYLPVDATLIPTGTLAPVGGTPFDFRQPRIVGDQMASTDEQLRYGSGFDHSFVLTPRTVALKPAARLRHARSGRVLEVATTEPGLQFYSGQWLGRDTDPDTLTFPSCGGLCLETQHFPDSPNRPHFPSTVLKPGQRYESLTTWTFSLD